MDKNQTLNLREASFRVIKPFVILGVLIIAGMIGFMIIEHMNLLDAFYMTIISLTTVGYETPKPLTIHGKLYTCIYLLFSVVIFLYLASEFAKHIINVNFRDIFSKRQMDSKIKKLKDHYIICGFGRTGRAIASQLSAENLDFVVIDLNTEAISEANTLDYLALVGDSTHDEVLNEARVKDARGLFASLSSDADNLFVTIAAKDLNPAIEIVVRCTIASNQARFQKAGATNVISPYTICGRRMVSSVVRPLVADFLDEALDTKLGLQLRMEQLYLNDNSYLIGKSILETNLRGQFGVYILAIKRGEDFIHNPTAETIFKAGDHLIVMGSTDKLLQLESQIHQKGSTLT